jgi:hypothetical protein
LIEVDGDQEILPKHMGQIDRITSELNRYSMKIAENEKETDALWKARGALSPESSLWS